nr:stromal membrane-associated protein 2-like [Oncorhynchus nerka]
MSTRSEREKAQKLNEQHQAILSKMLREDDNKHCADCEAKGPRWASWNLGVFMCIRCAGIHRNLGVHISRVKSVNLDQWTQEQIQSMVDMGNNKAKQLYEAHLPDTFRRPQTDQAVEFFIRDKYERKKYYDQNGLKTASVSVYTHTHTHTLICYTAIGTNNWCVSVYITLFVWGLYVNGSSLWQRGGEKQPYATTHPSCGARTKVYACMYVWLCILLMQVGFSKSIWPQIYLTNTHTHTHTHTHSVCSYVLSLQAVSSAAPGAPAVAASAGGSGGAAGPQANLDLFSEKNSSSTKTEEGAKKPLSKDSILSLYSNTTVSTQPAAPAAAMYMGQPPMQQFPSQPSGQPNFQTYPGVGGAMPPTTMTGGVMPQGGGAMMGQNSGMMVGMAMPNGGYMGMQQSMMGPPGGAMPAGAGTPQMYAAMQQQQQQQGQWNVSQMTQQISGIAMSGGVAAPPGFVQAGVPMGGGVGPPSGQTLSTQLWK